MYLMGQKKSLMFFKKNLTFFEFLGGFFSQGLMFFCDVDLDQKFPWSLMIKRGGMVAVGGCGGDLKDACI